VASAVHASPVGLSAAQITDALQNGHGQALFGQASNAGATPQQLAALHHLTRASFTTALNHILLVAAIIALACGVLAFVLIRQQDFVAHQPAEGAAVAS